MTRVAVKDFGPIAEASVELKPLTVFIGPNNSGKSYLALTIYCLSRPLFGDASSIGLVKMSMRHHLWPEFPPKLLERAGQELRNTWPKAASMARGPGLSPIHCLTVSAGNCNDAMVQQYMAWSGEGQPLVLLTCRSESQRRTAASYGRCKQMNRS